MVPLDGSVPKLFPSLFLFFKLEVDHGTSQILGAQRAQRRYAKRPTPGSGHRFFIHAKRVTIMPKDIQLARRIRSERS